MTDSNRANREAAEKAYYQNPVFCKSCGKIINLEDNVKVSQTKRKKFCSHSCAAKYNNLGVAKNKPKNRCIDCGAQIRIRVNRCKKCYNRHLGEYKKREKADVHRMFITKNARSVISMATGVSKECFICGYNLHVEACHIKPVAEFDSCAKVEEINSLSNLVWLCPNHHWEFDNLYDAKKKRDILGNTQVNCL